MQNMSLPTAHLPLPGNTTSGATATTNATMSDMPGSGDFNRILSQELTGKTSERTPGRESTGATTTTPLADNEKPSLSAQGATTSTQQALVSDAKTSEPVSIPSEILPIVLSSQVASDALLTALSSQVTGEASPVALSSQIANDTLLATLSSQVTGEASPVALSSQIANDTLLATLSGQVTDKIPVTAEALITDVAVTTEVAVTAEMPITVLPNQIANNILLTALSSQAAGGAATAILSSQTPGGVALAALQTGTSTQRNLSQGVHSAKPALGLDSTEAESNKTANFAGTDKLLPPIAADDKISRAVTQLLTQDSPGAGPSAQTGISSTISAASMFPGSSTIDQNQNQRLHAQVGTPVWNGELSQKVVWMATQQQQVAQLQLNPPNLGPMEVMLTVGKDPDSPARIEFTSPHLAVREAIEAALPRLREMMADNGISLGSATVSADSFQQQAQAGRQDNASSKQAGDMPQATSELAARSAATRVHTGLVDTFA